jgi:anthraniloyl-CoA monooxygenase
MNIAILGAGPAGLYCGLLLKKADPSRQVTIVERNPPDATYGWGVVFSDRTLASFHEADYATYKEITDHFVLWDAIDIRFRDEVIRCGGHVFAGLARKELLAILQRRCADLGVAMRFNTELAGPAELGAADLVIAADGVNSVTRAALAGEVQPRLVAGHSRFIWLGTDWPFDAFTFIFRENADGFFQVHAYPFSGATSTFIVECDERTWRRAGLDEATEAQSIAYCERLFADDLRSCRLLGNNSKWISFATVTCRRWHAGRVVLLGDAAHTAHFSIGSGTKLAMEDAIALAHAVDTYGATEAALTDYELERKPIVQTLQAAAGESQAYFERVRQTAHLAPPQFSFHLLTRSGRVTYDDLRLRDPRYVESVDRWYRAHATPADASAAPTPLFAPPPLFAPLGLRGLTLPSRLAVVAGSGAIEHVEWNDLADESVRWASTGAGLVLSPPVAVSADARITAGDAELYAPEHARRWAEIAAAVHAGGETKLGVVLNHAGRRGATHPRTIGLDRPLRDGAWPLVSAAAIPYTPRSQTPSALGQEGMERVRQEFVHAATAASMANVDLLLLHMGYGYLLASFLSPLANHRDDAYGDSLANRTRFPLEVFDAVRAVWPHDRPLAVALTVTDWAAGGLDVEDGVAIARALREHGCDLIQVLAGQTTSEYEPVYGRSFLTQLGDRVRNEAGIPVLVGGYLTTADEANTALAAGRADLCLMQPPLAGAFRVRTAPAVLLAGTAASCAAADSEPVPQAKKRQHRQQVRRDERIEGDKDEAEEAMSLRDGREAPPPMRG